MLRGEVLQFYFIPLAYPCLTYQGSGPQAQDPLH